MDCPNTVRAGRKAAGEKDTAKTTGQTGREECDAAYGVPMSPFDALVWVAFGLGCACLLMAGMFGWLLWWNWVRVRK